MDQYWPIVVGGAALAAVAVVWLLAAMAARLVAWASNRRYRE